jgi:hypothetical protein
VALGKIGLQNTDPESGPFIGNIQRSINRLFTAAGVDENILNGTTYNAPSGTILNGDNHELAFKKIAGKFHSITGHTHNPSIPGDGADVFIRTATSGQTGAVFLSSTDPLDISGNAFVGDEDGVVANANHTHRGVRSVKASGGIELFGDVVLTPSGDIQADTSGQQIVLFSPSEKVRSITISGGTELFGDVVLVPSGSIQSAISGQEIILFAPTGGSGTGGGSALTWRVPDSGGPVEGFVGSVPVFSLWWEDEEEIRAGITVPDSYTVGKQIKILGTKVQSAASSGNILLQAKTGLIRAGNTDMANPANTYTSTNTQLTLTQANVILDVGAIDLTDADGKINGVSVSGGDYLDIVLKRKTTLETSPAQDYANMLRQSGFPKFD